MAEYIEKARLRLMKVEECAWHTIEYAKGWKACIDWLKTLPTVELIRCKDCKHWEQTWTNSWSPNYHYCPMIDRSCPSDFYCADGEGREDD